MSVDHNDAVLIGTYATEHLAQLLASLLKTEKIPVAVISSDARGNFPRFNLVRSRVGLFVPAADAKRARQIARAFADRVLPPPVAPILGAISNLGPIAIVILSYTDTTGAISTVYSLTLFIPNFVLIAFFAIAVTVQTIRRKYSTRKRLRYVILYYLSLAAVSVTIF